MWDNVYATKNYVYGLEPNDFLKHRLAALKPGKVLCLAEGEGRNAVYLAKNGFEVTAVDSSAVGLEKAQRLALDNQVSITTLCVDLAEFEFLPNEWDSIISIFCHLPAPLRARVHQNVVIGLKPNGVLLLEAYTPEQLKYGTGGPPSADMMMSLAQLQHEFDGLRWELGQEIIRSVIEGEKHTGEAAVVQLIARK